MTAPRPTVLRTLTSAVVLDRRGDVELLREARGAPIECGGVYGQHVRLSGPWRIALEVDGVVADLPSVQQAEETVGERSRSRHLAGDLEILQEVVPLVDPPGALRSLRLRRLRAGPANVRLTSTFEPFLLPVLVEGIRPVEFQLETRPSELRAWHRGFGLAARWDLPPSRLYVDRASWRGGKRKGPLREVAVEHEVAVEERPSELRLALVGGLVRDLDRAAADAALPAPSEVAEGLTAAEAAWTAATPAMRLPDAPELEEAYGRARRMLHRLYTRPGDELTGLVAGFPWYAAIWGRDLAWMLPAVLWLGDHAWAEASLGSMLRFQAGRELDLLGAEAGELPMQVSPGPVFLFGTSDTTLHYPALVRRLALHSGQASAARRWLPAVKAAIGWGERRTDPATGLLRNGGEVATVERASASLAKVRYGIDAPDTTIWDSTDRRDHAIDIQVLWHEALEATAGLLRELAPEDRSADRYRALAERLRSSLGPRYTWPEEGYLYDSLRAGVGVRRLRPNALRAVSAGLLAPPVAADVVRRAGRPDLRTDWGLRTLSSADPAYSPTAYHDGQVWTIATAWAADAAFAVGDVPTALDLLRTIAERYAEEDGGANECYRGDRPEPYDSCFLLGFSVAPFLSVLFERLWGLTVDARRPQLTVRPAFPPSWRAASLRGLRVGQGRVSLDLQARALDVGWSGPGELLVLGPLGEARLAAGGSGRLPLA